MEGEKKENRKGEWMVDAQVLLLIDPGAELGWAELSERLPSGGGERKQDKRQLADYNEAIDEVITMHVEEA